MHIFIIKFIAKSQFPRALYLPSIWCPQKTNKQTKTHPQLLSSRGEGKFIIKRNITMVQKHRFRLFQIPCRDVVNNKFRKS